MGRYASGTGTSDATAIVSGAVALLRSRFPDMSGPEVVRRLTATATDRGPPGWDEQYGYGVLNIVAALTAELPTPPATSAAASPPAPDDNDQDNDNPTLAIAVGVLAATGALAAGIWARARRRRRQPVA
jgi:subtilisin family serine protease